MGAWAFRDQREQHVAELGVTSLSSLEPSTAAYKRPVPPWGRQWGNGACISVNRSKSGVFSWLSRQFYIVEPRVKIRGKLD